jgi:hypothetical protein
MNKIFYITIIIFFVSLKPAYAYLDPGSTSIIIQAILGFIAASITTLTFYWSKVKNFISKFFKKKVKTDKPE